MCVMCHILWHHSPCHPDFNKVGLAQGFENLSAGTCILKRVVVQKVDSQFFTQCVQLEIWQMRPGPLACISGIEPAAIREIKAFQVRSMANALPVKIAVMNYNFVIARFS